MEHERKLEWLNARRIIYRRDPITDIPDKVFDWGQFYEKGTYQCYTLFNSKAKITTYKSLKWHLYVLWYLNYGIDPKEFEEVAKFISNLWNGFVTFGVPKYILDNILEEVTSTDDSLAPPNKLRKIIFREHCKLTTHEKLSIVGQLIGKKGITETEIYDAMLWIHDNHETITTARLAAYLGCSERTVYRNMPEALKQEKELLNRELLTR